MTPQIFNRIQIRPNFIKNLKSNAEANTCCLEFMSIGLRCVKMDGLMKYNSNNIPSTSFVSKKNLV